MSAVLIFLSACTAKMPEDAGVKIYDTFYIPQYAQPEPNDATLKHYLKKNLYDTAGFDRLSADAAEAPRRLVQNTEDSQFLNEQMSETGLISYLYYDNGIIKYDALSNENRFGYLIDDDTPLWTHSIGKSWTSYLLGHAICSDTINDVYSPIDDWPLIEGTLYEGQRLIDLINMRAGDQFVVTEADGLIETGRWFNVHPLYSFAQRELAGTSSASREYNYNGLVTNVVLNYILFKVEDEETFLNEVFTKKAGIENPLFFMTQRGLPLEFGPVRYSARASRYDFLRVGIAMLDDWNNNGCMNDYFRTLLDESKRKGFTNRQHPHKNESALRYGGFFHTHYIGMQNRNVLGMDGYGGQSQLIDFDNNRIVSVNTIHTNYDWGELVYRGIKNGDIRKE
jgi:hypothetical protein